MPFKYCETSGKVGYSTFAEAESACISDPNCQAVHDPNSKPHNDNYGMFYHCSKTEELQSYFSQSDQGYIYIKGKLFSTCNMIYLNPII